MVEVVKSYFGSLCHTALFSVLLLWVLESGITPFLPAFKGE